MPQGKKPNMTQYQTEYSEFKWDVPEYFNFAVDVVDKWAKKKDKLALWWVDDHGTEVRKTFRDISQASKRVANTLISLGIKKDEVVLLVLPRNIEWWEAMTACIRMGVMVAPGTPQLSPKDLQYRCEMSQAACIITDDAGAAKFEEVAARCPSIKTKIIITNPKKGWLFYDDLKEKASRSFKSVATCSGDNCLLFFTSGASGPPKMALHTHASYAIGHQVTGKYWLDLKPDELVCNISDAGWAKASWSSYFAPWIMGAAVFVHFSEQFDPGKILYHLSKYPINVLCCAPTIYRLLVLEEALTRHRFPALRHCVAAGEPLNAEIIQVWKLSTGCTIRDGYGQTETVLLCGSFPCLEPRFGSMGKPTPGIHLAVIDEEGKILPPHTEGFIAVQTKPERPVGLFKEYWKSPGQTGSVFQNGWYLTGDRATVDEDGYFWFVGRADDVIITSGYRVGPFEVESALMEHPAVAETAVVSSPDKTRNEIVKAFVILLPGFKPSASLELELQEHVKKITAPYKYPRKIEFVETLPKTISGKIRRVDLRNREWENALPLPNNP
jgi:acyl-coenzyme A synthetase/AMP-(fatty) acid ligase